MRLAPSFRAMPDGASSRAAPASPSRSPLDRARAALRRGDSTVALAAFDAAVAEDPACGLAHLGRATCLRELGRAAESAAALGRAVELEDASALVVLARAAAGGGDYLTAMATIERALIARKEGEPSAFAVLRDHPLYLAALGEL